MDLLKIIFKKLNYFFIPIGKLPSFSKIIRILFLFLISTLFSLQSFSESQFIGIIKNSDGTTSEVLIKPENSDEYPDDSDIENGLKQLNEFTKRNKEVAVSSFSKRTFPDGQIGDDVKYIGTFVKDPELVNSWSRLSQSGSDIVGKCWDSRNSADSYCLESLSPDIQSTVGTIQQIASVAQMGGIFDICKTSGKILNVAQAGMTAYTAACGLAKSSCDTSCKEAMDGLKNFRNTLMKYCNSEYASATQGIDQGKFKISCSKVNTFLNQELDKGLKATVSSNAEKCKSYTEQIKTGLIAGVGLFSSIMRSKACQKASSAVNCSQNPLDPNCAPKKKLCSDPSIANTPACICENNPHSPGCGANISSYDKASQSATSIGGKELMGTASSNLGINNSDAHSNTGIREEGTGGSFGGTGFGGGSSGGGGGGIGGGGGSAANAKGTASSLNGKIGDAGFEGSGGGGGRRMNGSAKLSDNSDSQGLRRFLPKTPKGANYVPGSEPAYEISTAHGKTLFERVSDRYRDNFK